MPTDVANITRENVEAFLADLLERRSPATANNRYRGLQQLFAWLAEEGEIRVSPMARVKPPSIPDQPVAVPKVADIRALLATCAGNTLEDRRDTAIIRLFADTGVRLAELAGLQLDGENGPDVDLDQGPGSWARAAGRGS
jgi:site-specific recombinase XerD